MLNTTKLDLTRLSVYDSVIKVKRRNIHFLYDGEALVVIPGAHELIEIAELINKETNANVTIDSDKNTMKYIMEIKQGALNFDTEKSIAPLLGFRKIVYKQGKYTSQKVTDIMVFFY